jgi:Fe-S-cluster-containing hydrogenase component 2
VTKSFSTSGIATQEELRGSPGYPSEARMRKGAVAVIECLQEIPCDPCEAACPVGAITVGQPITNLPVLDESKCTGCGLCLAACPGQAIFLVDLASADGEAVIAFPYEFLPLPSKGTWVEAVNREGAVVTSGRVVRVLNPRKYDRTAVVYVAVPREYAHEVRCIKRERYQQGAG